MASHSAVALSNSATPPAPAETSPSMALIPASPHPANNAAANAVPRPTSTPYPMHTGPHHEADEPWALVTKALIVAVMGSQPAGTAASTLLTVFHPLLEGWSGARRESKRWKERAEAYMAEHHKHKMETSHKYDTLQAQVQALESKVAQSEAKVREVESNHSTVKSSASALEKKLAEAGAAKQALFQQAQELQKEVQAKALQVQDSKAALEKFRQEADSKSRAQQAEMNKLLDKVKQNEGIKAQAEDRLQIELRKNASLEEQTTQKAQEISNLQTRITELTAHKGQLERQLALYQRIPTRRF